MVSTEYPESRRKPFYELKTGQPNNHFMNRKKNTE
jgi:hypothetical protein